MLEVQKLGEKNGKKKSSGLSIVTRQYGKRNVKKRATCFSFPLFVLPLRFPPRIYSICPRTNCQKRRRRGEAAKTLKTSFGQFRTLLFPRKKRGIYPAKCSPSYLAVLYKAKGVREEGRRTRRFPVDAQILILRYYFSLLLSARGVQREREKEGKR